VEISYGNRRLEELCKKEAVARRRLGPAGAKKLRTRLNSLAAASNVRELWGGRPHTLRGNLEGQFALDLAGGHRLIFRPNHDPVPRMETGDVDWSSVEKVTITDIGDYHRG